MQIMNQKKLDAMYEELAKLKGTTVEVVREELKDRVPLYFKDLERRAKMLGITVEEVRKRDNEACKEPFKSDYIDSLFDSLFKC